MKKLLYILVFSTLSISCSSGSSDDAGDGGNKGSGTDSTPTVPQLVFPSEDQLCIDNTLNFTWNASTNEDGSSVIYTFEIATDNQFSNIVTSEVQTSLSKIVTLDKGVAYYWRVKAKSTKKIESAYSPFSQFYTEEVPNTNNLPFSPANTTPFVGQNFNNVSTINLEWTASDVDEDPLKFNVYFGKDKNALTLVAENISNTSLDVTADTANTKYYWKVISKDDKGAQTSSPTWEFKVNNL
ncbi:hypothetical protein [Algibacter pectinivorans]|uniref:Fibronectin type-III domain-containing protein n=1 Tax=Algibacter pectinivorans TaxID=870482 RepID=A0A1I1Q5V5_9FLAO|nr:hypothetical protein [Algibacter pectinivorans]SFD17352.1 hypothetical protein SAMN04487987_105208 [Algibacter pectinivorans]